MEVKQKLAAEPAIEGIPNRSRIAPFNKQPPRLSLKSSQPCANMLFIIKSIYILIPLSLYYLINFYLSLSFYFYSSLLLSCSCSCSASWCLHKSCIASSRFCRTCTEIKWNLVLLLLPLFLFKTGAAGCWSHCAYSSAFLAWCSSSTESIPHNCLTVWLTATLRIKVYYCS